MFSKIIKTYLAIPNGDKYSSKFAYPNDLRSDKKKERNDSPMLAVSWK